MQDMLGEPAVVKPGWILLGCSSASSTFRLKTFTASLRAFISTGMAASGCSSWFLLEFLDLENASKTIEDVWITWNHPVHMGSAVGEIKI